MGLLPEIRQKIDAWLEGGHGRSPTNLAQLASVSQTTTRRIIQGESISTFGNMANILSVVLGEDCSELPSLMKKQYPKDSRAIDIFLGDGVVSDDRRGRLNKVIESNPLCIVIYALIESLDDVSEDQILKEYGRIGQRALTSLMEEGLVEEASGSFRCTNNGGKMNFTAKSMIRSIAAHSDIQNLENLENDYGVASLQWGSASSEGYNLAIKLTAEYVSNMKKLIDENPGKIPMYSVVYNNSYIELKSFLSKENKK